MSDILEVACRTHQVVLWIGQSTVRTPGAYVYGSPRVLSALAAFFVEHESPCILAAGLATSCDFDDYMDITPEDFEYEAPSE